MIGTTAYFFDLDGTLTDSRTGLFASFRAGLAALGAPAVTDDGLQRFLGTPLPDIFRSVRPAVTQAEVKAGIQAFRDHFEREGILANTLYPGAREMLEAVRAAGATAWVVTSKPQPHACRVVSQLRLDPLISGIMGAGLDETDTKTDLVARALDAARVPPAEAVMLGDRHYDVVGALQNGVAAVGALWGYGTERELADAGCTAFATSPGDFDRRFVATVPFQAHAAAA